MSRVAINTGSVANDGTGTSLRIAGGIINDNFSEIYSQFGDGTNLTPTWNKTAAGINTTSSVGIGTTNPRFTLEVGAVGASGTSLWVNGNARVTGILTVGSSSIVLDGNANKILVGSGISLDGNTGIISATAFYAGGSLITGGGGSGGGLNYWGSSASGISTTANVAIGTVTPTSKLTVVGNSLFSGIATFRNNLTLANLTSSSNTLRFGSNSYIDQSNSDVFTFQINSGTDGSGTDSSFVFRTTEPGVFPIPDQSYDAFRVYSGGNYWNRLVRVYTNFHADNNAFVGGSLQVGAASTLIGAGSTLGSFKVGAGGTVINTTSTGLVGIGTSVPNSKLHVVGISTFNGDVYIDDKLYVNGIEITSSGGGGGVSIGEDISTRNLSVSGISTLNSNVSVGGTISVNGGVKLATNNATIVGTSGTVGEIKRIGGAPFFYDGSAWREFVLSSGTPVSVPADTEWDNVVFRSTFDTDFTDAKFGATPVRVSSGSTIVGSPTKIGTGAFRNNGGAINGIGVSYAYRSDYDFTGSWTIEFWIYHDSTPLTFESLVSQVSSTNSSGDWTFGMYNTGSNIQWYWQNKNGTYTVLNSVSNATFNTNFVDKWSHYALVREGDNGSLHFYINGTETTYTYVDQVIDNDILHINGAGLGFGAAFGGGVPVIGSNNWNNGYSIDAIFDDVRISCGVGTAGQRYTSIGSYLTPTFTPSTTALPTTGTLSSYVQPPGDKYGEVTLGGSPTWRGTSGVTVSQQSSGNYRVSFASTYTNANDYFVLTQAMDQGFASYVGVARSTTHVDFAINRESDNSDVNTGSLSVQIKNHI
jgi:hypothetical protein